MSKPVSRVASPASLLYLFVIGAQMIGGVYLAGEREPPQSFSMLSALGFVWVVGWWLRNDSRERGVGWVLDMGLFLYIAWPLIMPYYLIKTRGAKGLLAILTFVAAYVGAA